MTTPDDLAALQRIADRSLEGRSMSLYRLSEDDIDQSTVRKLEADGLIEVRDRGGEPNVSLTDAGFGVLTPSNSA